jgi:hypothetical protein
MHSQYHPELDAYIIYTYNNPEYYTEAEILHELHPNEVILFMDEHENTTFFYNPYRHDTTGNRVNLIVNGELKTKKNKDEMG